MKNIYIVYNIKKDNKFFANVLKTSESDNLLAVLKRIPDVVTANIYPKNRAYEIADAWNESYKNNGTSLLTY